jgi:hypothetical protein
LVHQLPSLRCALLPLDIRDLCELEIRRVGGEQARGLGVTCCEADLRVDVEHARGAARRPDGGDGVGGVVLEVVTCYRAGKGVLGGGLWKSKYV